MQLDHAETFIKTLSANDVGVTGGHQAGILIPRVRRILEFFPELDSEERNPRSTVTFLDAQSGAIWSFSYIYYNGAITGDSTRNEYRLTGMTSYLREKHVAVGDGLELSKSVTGERYISHHRNDSTTAFENADLDPDVVVLSGTWKTRKARTL